MIIYISTWISITSLKIFFCSSCCKYLLHNSPRLVKRLWIERHRSSSIKFLLVKWAWNCPAWVHFRSVSTEPQEPPITRVYTLLPRFMIHGTLLRPSLGLGCTAWWLSTRRNGKCMWCPWVTRNASYEAGVN